MQLRITAVTKAAKQLQPQQQPQLQLQQHSQCICSKRSSNYSGNSNNRSCSCSSNNWTNSSSNNYRYNLWQVFGLMRKYNELFVAYLSHASFLHFGWRITALQPGSSTANPDKCLYRFTKVPFHFGKSSSAFLPLHHTLRSLYLYTHVNLPNRLLPMCVQPCKMYHSCCLSKPWDLHNH